MTNIILIDRRRLRVDCRDGADVVNETLGYSVAVQGTVQEQHWLSVACDSAGVLNHVGTRRRTGYRPHCQQIGKKIREEGFEGRQGVRGDDLRIEIDSVAESV